MVNESSQPKPGDAVLGGQNPPPIDAAVLGGIEGVKRRYADPSPYIRSAALKEAVKYGEKGIELLLHGLDDRARAGDKSVSLVAYLLLQEIEPALKMLLEAKSPYKYRIIKRPFDLVALYHNYLKIKQSENSSLSQAFQSLNNGTQAEQQAAFSQLQSSQEPVIQETLRLYLNASGASPCNWLEYLLEMKRWQEAEQEIEYILLELSDCEKGTAISEILKSEFDRSPVMPTQHSWETCRYVERKIPTDKLRPIYEFCQKFFNANSGSSQVEEIPNFWVAFQTRINEMLIEDEESEQCFEKMRHQRECDNYSESVRDSYSGNNW